MGNQKRTIDNNFGSMGTPADGEDDDRAILESIEEDSSSPGR